MQNLSKEHFKTLQKDTKVNKNKLRNICFGIQTCHEDNIPQDKICLKVHENQGHNKFSST